MNTPEARPDYHFDEEAGFNWLNIEAVLPGTRVPVDIDITNSGDDPAVQLRTRCAGPLLCG